MFLNIIECFWKYQIHYINIINDNIFMGNFLYVFLTFLPQIQHKFYKSFYLLKYVNCYIFHILL